MPSALTINQRDRVLHLGTAEPAAAIADSAELALQILQVCHEVESQLERLAAVVLEGAADSFFIPAPRTAADLDQLPDEWDAAVRAVSDLSVPTLASLRGDAVGPALALALACDLRVAADSVHLGSPEVSMHRFPTCGLLQRLARVVGPSSAIELVLRGETMNAEDALTRGLVHRVWPRTEYDYELDQLLSSIHQAAPVALHFAKETVKLAEETPLDVGLRLEADLAALLLTTQDRAEGIEAFLQRRTPTFQGR